MADLLGYLISGLGSLLSSFFVFLMKPIKYILEFFAAVFYLLYKVGVILIDVLALSWAFIQLVSSIVVGVFRTITGFLSWSGAPMQSTVSLEGVRLFSQAVDPYGLNIVLPMLLLALDVFLTAYLIIKIVGGRG